MNLDTSVKVREKTKTKKSSLSAYVAAVVMAIWKEVIAEEQRTKYFFYCQFDVVNGAPLTETD